MEILCAGLLQYDQFGYSGKVFFIRSDTRDYVKVYRRLSVPKKKKEKKKGPINTRP